MNAHAYMQMAYVAGVNGPIGVQVMHANRAPIRGFKFSREAKTLLSKINASQADNKICAIQPGDLVNVLPRELYQIACLTGASFVKPLDDTPEGHQAAAIVADKCKLGNAPAEPMQSFGSAMQTIITQAKHKQRTKSDIKPAAKPAPPRCVAATQPATQPATRQATQPATRQATQPATKPAAKPATKPAAKPATKSDLPCTAGKSKKQKATFGAVSLGTDQPPPLVELNEYEHGILCAAALLGILQKSNVDYESDSEYEPRPDHWCIRL